ncbi:MAG: hypothetical protein VYC19_11350 [Pseudomonadota bacterium]|jgi:hypothetical protein|nr:hypothetical protein [Pseudomonadota bacterium]
MMSNAWQELKDFFQNNKNVQLTTDSADEHVIEDPRDTSNIMSINMIFRSDVSDVTVDDNVQKIQKILDDNAIVGVASKTSGAGNAKGIMILAEQPLPKSLGIRSQFNGVSVGFSIVENLDNFKASGNSQPKMNP